MIPPIESPVFQASQKLVALKAAAQHLGVAPEDMAYLAIVIMQTAERTKSSMRFLDVAAQLIVAPDHIKKSVEELIKPLRELNGKIKPEAMNRLILESHVSLLSETLGFYITGIDIAGPPCRSSGDG